MPFISEQFTSKTLQVALAIIALASLAAFGLGEFPATNEAQAAPTCQTENVGSISLAVQSSSSDGSTDQDDAEDTLDLNPYVSGDEYVNKIFFDAALSTGEDDECDGGGAICNLEAHASVEAVSVGGNPLASLDLVTNGGSLESKNQIVTLTLGGSSNYPSAIFSVATEVSSSDDPGFPGGGIPSSITASASLSNVTLEICEPAPGNIDPIARPDGIPTDPMPINVGQVTLIDVLNNDGTPRGSGTDSEGDPITISQITNYGASFSSVSVVTDGGIKKLRYDAGTGSVGDTDQLTYQISDGQGGFDTADVNIELTDAVGNVTLNTSGIPAELKDQVFIDPTYIFDGVDKAGQADAEVAGSSGWNVPIDKTGRIFEILEAAITLPEGYRLSGEGTENPPIRKISVTPAGDLTGQENTAKLGVSYDNPSGSCPSDPDPSVDANPVADARFNLNSEDGPAYEYRYNLSGQFSTDDEDCSNLEYKWTFTSSGSDSIPFASIADDEAEITFFDISDEPGAAGQEDAEVTYDIDLKVTDQSGNTDTDSVTITIDCDPDPVTGEKECTAPDSGS